MTQREHPYRICFVCTGNICRSPIAEVVMRELVRQRGLEQHIQVDSAGTGEWHIGEKADHRALDALAAHGYDGNAHRARLIQPEWFNQRDLFVALDRSHLRELRSLTQLEHQRDTVVLLRSFDQPLAGAHVAVPDAEHADVADPYYQPDEAFTQVLAQVENACANLLDWVQQSQLRPAAR